MTVKHQPATPLPWRATNWTDHAKGTVLVDDASHPLGKAKVADCEGSASRREADAAYIAHAANAYPKLVEALRNVVTGRGSEPYIAAENAIDDARAARALLRELGEADAPAPVAPPDPEAERQMAELRRFATVKGIE